MGLHEPLGQRDRWLQSKVAGKFTGTTTIPGIGDHPGATTLGGRDLAISSFAENTETASDFIAYIGASKDCAEAVDHGG